MTRTIEPAIETFQPPAGTSPPPMDGFSSFDMVKMQAFIQKVMGDLSGAVISVVSALGDRLGLFKDLAVNGPATSVELAARAGVNERYVREWLSALASAGYLEYDPRSRRFTLPIEHAAVLAQEGGMMFLGGGSQLLIGLVGPLDRLTEAFRTGEGVLQETYDENLLRGMERMSATWFENLLVQQWIPALPDMQTRLERGARVADVGCGSGQALIKLAQAFPNSHFVGYDAFDQAITRANANAVAAGVADRVRFEQRDIVDGLHEHYDLITTFDAMHDFIDVQGGLQAIRQALRPDGTYLLLEMKCSDKLEENSGPVGAILYGTSVLYNLPVSLANDGDGLGTMGLPESKVKELCTEAGFSSVRRLPVENPFNILYEIKH